jgi:hypothetical protein
MAKPRMTLMPSWSIGSAGVICMGLGVMTPTYTFSSMSHPVGPRPWRHQDKGVALQEKGACKPRKAEAR